MTRANRLAAPIQHLLWALLLLTGCIDASVGQPDVCTFRGEGYALNEDFIGPMGCETCTCEAPGRIRCYEDACYDEPGKKDASLPYDSSIVGPGSGDASYPWPFQDASFGFDPIHCNTGLLGQAIRDNPCFQCVCDIYGCRAEHVVGCIPGSPARDAGADASSPACGDGGCSPACGDGGCSSGCLWAGTLYDVGDSYPGYGGYNTCTCTPYGTQCSDVVWGPICSKGGTSFASGTSVLCEDGCNTCSCDGTSWTSTNRECAPLQGVERCPSDARGLEKARLLYRDGDRLAVEVTSPACPGAVPELKLCFNGTFVGHHPSRVTLDFVPATTSACATTNTQQKVIDLRPLRAAYQAQFTTPSTTLQVQLENLSFDYTF